MAFFTSMPVGVPLIPSESDADVEDNLSQCTDATITSQDTVCGQDQAQHAQCREGILQPAQPHNASAPQHENVALSDQHATMQDDMIMQYMQAAQQGKT